MKISKHAFKDLKAQGLIAHVWIYDPETGESIRKIAITDRARDLINGLARKEF